MNAYTQCIVIGSGIAGLNFALRVAEKGKVTVITKKKIVESSTNRAQGGIAAVLDKTDNIEKHIKDTLEAGCHHNDRRAVEFMVRHGPEAIFRLIELGTPFDEEDGKLALAREGGHHMRRIAHVGDYTGKAIESVLVKKVKQNKNIEIMENTFALDLLTKNKICYGVQIIKNNKIENLYAPTTVLATGGMGQLYKYTTNPTISTGDGIAMACRAGCVLKDLEFIQFHPTAFIKKKGGTVFLLSEALRGEGAILRNAKKEAFMHRYHKDKDLAPRDIVSRAIFEEMKKGEVYLDMTHKNAKETKIRFPQIYQTLKKYGYDLTKDLIPIIPAAHYLCGGIQVDLKGHTNIKNLYAFGEVTCTGVHGANRLASNSLLEAIVFSDQIIKNFPKPQNFNHQKFSIPKLTAQKLNIKFIQQKLKDLMWKHIGIIRTKEGLKLAIEEIQKLLKFLPGKETDKAIAETRNMLETALLITKSALNRPQSLGCHFIKKQCQAFELTSFCA